MSAFFLHLWFLLVPPLAEVNQEARQGELGDAVHEGPSLEQSERVNGVGDSMNELYPPLSVVIRALWPQPILPAMYTP